MADFKLSKNFIEKYIGQQPNWGPLGYITYKRTYARPISENITEEFWQTLQRVVETTYEIQKRHCALYRLPWKPLKAQLSAQKMYELMWNFKFLPPGRGLWAMSMDLIDKKGGGALNNCAFHSTDDMQNQPTLPFEFMMDMSMLGVGVGFDVKGAGTIKITEPKDSIPYVIADSREGWIESLRLLLEAYLQGGNMPIFDYSEIRPEGVPINGFGGLASGPDPLEDLHKDIIKIFQDRSDEYITISDIVDIMNFIGRTVVAGNVRRSAQIVFGDAENEEYITLKQDQEKLMSHRWASNNSIFAEVGMDYTTVAQATGINGEPGYAWLENMKAYGRMKDGINNKDERAKGGNPCLEQTLESGEMCNLVETFPANHESFDEYQLTLKYAYLYAKTVTLIPTHNESTNAIIARNRRIGLSQSGIIQSFQRHGRRTHFDWCDQGYNYILGLDKIYSDWLGIARSIKVTSVKPSGTISLLAGATAGIHYAHAEWYIRRIRFSKDSPLVKALLEAGYKVEDDEYSKTSVVVEFPVHEENFDRKKTDVTMWEQFENAAQMQHYWADNQVSITITFNKNEAQNLPYALEMYETRLKGVSLLPLSEHGYVQAPYEEISQEAYELSMSKIKPLVLTESKNEVQERFCDSDTCVI